VATPSSLLEEARRPVERAARLLALADGLCAIGQYRTGERSGQFSIFNFLLRAARDGDAGASDGRDEYVVMMRAGIFRRHAWYLRYRLAEQGLPLRLALPGPIDRSWQWWDDVEEITRRLEPSDAWADAVGRSLADHTQHFTEALATAQVVKLERESTQGR